MSLIVIRTRMHDIRFRNWLHATDYRHNTFACSCILSEFGCMRRRSVRIAGMHPNFDPKPACMAFCIEIGHMRPTFDVIYPHATAPCPNSAACGAYLPRLLACGKTHVPTTRTNSDPICNYMHAAKMPPNPLACSWNSQIEKGFGNFTVWCRIRIRLA